MLHRCHEERDQVEQSVDDPDDEDERCQSELRTERRLPHIPVVLLPRVLVHIAAGASEPAVHADCLPRLFIHWRHAHGLLLLANLSVGRPGRISLVAVQITQRVHVRH